MRFASAMFIALLATLLLGSTLATSRGSSGYVTEYFAQPVEQSQSSSAKFKQRVLVNSEFASGADAPTFLYLGPQGPVDPASVTKGFVYDLAKTHGALLLALEHRFNGESYPVRSLETKNLKSLTVENALGDVARFLRDYVYDDKPLNSVILFGSEYGGTIAAWLRVRHPSLTVAAISASAIVGLRPQFREYMDSLTQAVTRSWKGKSDCAGVIQRAIEYIGILIGSDGRWSEHSRYGGEFKLCNRVPHYENWLAQQEASVACVTKEIAAKVTAEGIDELCSALVPEGDEKDIWTVGRFVVSQLAKSGDECLENEYYSQNIVPFNSTTIADNTSGLRQHMYLACNELGTFLATDYNYAPQFEVYYYYMCVEAFGKELEDYKTLIANGNARLNSEFGGTKYRGNKVFFTNAQVDPLSSPDLSVFVSKPESEVFALTSVGASRSAILGTATGGSLEADRATVGTQVATWLKGDKAVRASTNNNSGVSEELLRSLKL
jgi:hypothetical protein